LLGFSRLRARTRASARASRDESRFRERERTNGLSSSSVVPGRHDCRRLDHQHDGAPPRMRPVHDAPRDRHPLAGVEHKRPAPLYLELEPALEHEKELILLLVLVPIDEPALDDRETDYVVIDSRERL